MGSHFVRWIYDKYPNYEIYNYDLLTYAGNLNNLLDVTNRDKNERGEGQRYFFIQGDIRDERLLSALFNRHNFDVVINFAAESHVDRSIMNALEFIKTNVHGAYLLFEAAKVHNVPRFIYISTDEVYGDVPGSKKSAESYPLQPSNPYAASKASADLIAQSYIRTHKLPIMIIRSSNNYGSYQYPEKLHPLVITNILEDRPIPLHGNGQHVRSWIHVFDFCSALDLVMHEGADYSVYNFAGEEKTNLEVVRTILRILGKDERKYVKFINDRPGADLRYSPDDGKICSELGWKRKYFYESAVEELIEWYVNNDVWWKDVRRKAEFLNHYNEQAKGYTEFKEKLPVGNRMF